MNHASRKILSLLLAVILALSLAVTPALAAGDKAPPTAVENCDVSGLWTTTVNLGFADTVWMNSITAVTVNDTAYEKQTISSFGSDTKIWDIGSASSAYGSYTALRLAVENDTFATNTATVRISADGYKDVTIEVTKKTESYNDIYTATVIQDADNGNDSGNDSGSTEKKDPPASFTRPSFSLSDFKLLFTAEDVDWLNSISGVTVDGVAYTKGYTYRNTAYAIGTATNEMDGCYLNIGEGFETETATCVISAEGYKDLTLKLEKTGNKATIVESSDSDNSSNTNPDTPSGDKDAPTNFTTASSFGYDFKLTFTDAADWLGAIEAVKVNDAAYEKGSSSYSVWNNKAYYADAGNAYLLIGEGFDGDTATCVISAKGYKNLTLKLNKTDHSATVVENGDNGSTDPEPDTPSGDKTTPTAVKYAYGSLMPAAHYFGVDSKDQDWLNAITGVKVNGTTYEKGDVGYSASGKFWNLGKKDLTGYGSETTLVVLDNSDVQYPADFTVSATGYKDVVIRVASKNASSATIVESTTPDPVEKKTVELSKVSFAEDSFGNDWLVSIGEDGYLAQITGVSVNGTAWEKKDYDPSAGGAYRVNSDTQKLVFSKKDFSASPTIPVLKSGDVITITANGYEDLTFKLIIDTDGKASVVADDGQGDIYQLHVKIEGSFEAAIVGQKDYDGVSGASTGGATSNKNSAVTVYGARLTKGETPADADWKALDASADPSTGYIDGSKCSVSIVPDTAKGTDPNADSGMAGVFMPAISSSLSLSGTPKDAGSYLISLTVTDDQGRTATSNALPFRVYTGEETLADQLVLENLKQYQNGLYAWDIMEPWAIKNFGSNVPGETESVRVPEKLEAWFGSHESGLYGYLGYDLAWDKVLAGEIPQTLYIPNGCDLTITNMEILSSVRIVVENGGKLTLSDSTVQGMIDVQSGGTFSMNYDSFNQEFTTGASVCGQIRLADGAILENAAIYSHANYLANGDLTDRTTHDPVVVANGNVTVKGKVFIAGEEAGDNKIGQTGLLVRNGTLTLADDATLVVYGGAAKVQLFPKGGTAIELDNGTITGNGKLVAIGGQPLWGEGGDAVTGTGTISTVEAFLQGATASTSNKKDPGQAVRGNVTVISPKQHKENGTIKDTVADDPLDGLYWKTGIDAMPPLDKFVTREVDNSVKFFTVADIPSVTYTGAEQKPAVTVKDGDTVLTEGADYELSYLDATGAALSGLPKEVGSYTVVITGKGAYADTVADKSFTITRRSSGGGSSSGSSSKYDIVVDTAKNGAVSADRSSASSGQTVTVTIKPATGYKLDKLTVVTGADKSLSLTNKGNGAYSFTMPSSKVTVSADFVKETADNDKSFVDVSDDAYYIKAVKWAVEKGITTGSTANTFNPEAVCTRAQMMTFLWRSAGSPAPKSASNPFADISKDAYYYDAVLWAVENGITKGTSDTAFSPDEVVTRAQTVTFLHRMAGSPAAAANSSFQDVDADAYYSAAVQWAVAQGITQGTSATTFSANDACDRAQVVTFLYRQNNGK